MKSLKDWLQSFLPVWLYWSLLFASLLIVVSVVMLGMWFVSTQIEFM